MTYTQVMDSIINVIRGKVAMLNLVVNKVHPEHENIERFRAEIRGMLECLNNICSANEEWCIYYHGDFTEFGYYDVNGNWVSVEK